MPDKGACVNLFEPEDRLLQCVLVQCSVIAHKGGYRCRERSLTHCQNSSSFCIRKAIPLTEHVGKGRRALRSAEET